MLPDPNRKAKYIPAPKSLVHVCSSVIQTLGSTDKEVEDLSAGTTISCLSLVEGTLQFHHTWPRPVCLCKPHNIWDHFSWQCFLIWLTLRSNHSFWREGGWLTTYTGSFSEPKSTIMRPKSFSLVCFYGCSVSFLNFSCFITIHTDLVLQFFQHLGWKPYIKVIYLYFLFVMLRIYFRASHILVEALSLRASPKTIFFKYVFVQV